MPNISMLKEFNSSKEDVQFLSKGPILLSSLGMSDKGYKMELYQY